MKIIVICTGNTCRSQIAEGLLKSKYPDAEIYSAGTYPETHVNPYAVKAMAESGYDISKQYPKLVNDFIKDEFDHVLTVCDSAQETCPVFPNAKNRVHRSFVDPSRSSYESDDPVSYTHLTLPTIYSV